MSTPNDRPATRYPQAILKGLNIPWTEDYRLDAGRFVDHAGRLLDLGYTHVYTFGTAGEGHAVTDEQFRRVVDVFADVAVGDGMFPQVGVIGVSVGQMIERIAYAEGRGVRTMQIALPPWGPMQDVEKVGFFQEVCGRFPEVSFLHYNYPYAFNTMTAADYERVIDAVPNLVATKISTTDMGFVQELMQRAGELQHFFLQGPYPYGATLGECSLISSLGPVFPVVSRELFEAGRSGDVARAFTIQRRLGEAAKGIYGAVRERHIDGAYDKLVSWLVDPTFPRRLLPPYRPVSDEAAAQARRFYEEACTDLS